MANKYVCYITADTTFCRITQCISSNLHMYSTITHSKLIIPPVPIHRHWWLHTTLQAPDANLENSDQTGGREWTVCSACCVNFIMCKRNNSITHYVLTCSILTAHATVLIFQFVCSCNLLWGGQNLNITFSKVNIAAMCFTVN